MSALVTSECRSADCSSCIRSRQWCSLSEASGAPLAGSGWCSLLNFPDETTSRLQSDHDKDTQRLILGLRRRTHGPTNHRSRYCGASSRSDCGVTETCDRRRRGASLSTDDHPLCRHKVKAPKECGNEREGRGVATGGQRAQEGVGHRIGGRERGVGLRTSGRWSMLGNGYWIMRLTDNGQTVSAFVKSMALGHPS